ncbi:NAD(P)-binding protein [Hyphopichia burtonii NRRL Y-1933]|uniref:NAD(P)-binding protein n=1 Tax=Hyphopichia burtonii NRRL Y-1933 TaxID=984485 RepID=A0A1E4RCD1_9ASCO|nr:NAD(P)-binding protein [Hyphopichia burtonii NRRL Y-1933]ODV64917.1 NAD(P)-binding protein [Hyphopichia burtonii NRRL Y-1933]
MSFPSEIKQLVLNQSVSKEVNVKLGEPNSTFKLETVKIDQLSIKDGFILVKVLYLSNDPTQRVWIQKGLDASRMYVPPVKEGEPMRSLAVGKVIESKSDKFSKGDLVSGALHWSDYAIVHEQAIWNKVDTSSGLPIPTFMSSLGMTGLTAYFGLTEVGQFKEGQTIIVSAASGATGSMVVQIAKHLLKAGKVIGITGSKEKGKYVESLGADFTVDYHDEDWKQQLSDYIGNDYVDAYYDNVGGDMLSFVLKKIKSFGVVIACGSIAGYNDSSKNAVTSWSEIIVNRLRVQGFIVSDFKDKFPQAIGAIVQGVKSGSIKATEGYNVNDLSDGLQLEKIPEIWYQLFASNKPNGKLLTKLADE